MPEMLFHVRWPDGAESRCYSPSLVVADHLACGQSYRVPDFLARSRAALTEASARVQARYGFPCSRALAQLDEIERRCAAFAEAPGARIHVVGFDQHSS
ncbi:MSMEG_0570 family nitrogen starvation response protein [Gluconacetobacter tumulisoli]|uniref:MSMEG_0570 family nitrogen starvation response protein n=1 Tax=Gluconacetobacter tumulisoli TaxID=1286189 RepID=A0A7W4K5U3_9PROT|nr:MSMEG_0570 family nitrogen starvation response protein [Gluconacetobacter tumulisoli]MBB2200901.1 MSMEG_0570 family nitrogen starvation response protein [Gluconacetobacter tumulisoli]